jgi:hypothetical protein
MCFAAEVGLMKFVHVKTNQLNCVGDVPIQRNICLEFVSEIHLPVTTLASEGRGTKSHVLLDNMASYYSSIVRRQWGSVSALRTKDEMGDNNSGKLQMVHRLSDLGSTTSDHLVHVVGVTIHDDGVLDQRPSVGATVAGVRCSR